MIDPAELIAATLSGHAALNEGAWHLPQLAPARLAAPQPEAPITGLAQVEQRIAELDSDHVGWCRRESWVGRTPCAATADCGPPLDGEWVSADGATSMRLLFAGDDWRFFTIAEQPGGAPALRETVTILGHGGMRLRYAVYWTGRMDDPAGLRRIACRLVGIDEKGGR